MTATQDDAIAELQRATAELRRERDAALTRETALAEALAQRDSEFGERIEHQAATIDVLRAMSASPGDPQPVFDLIARQAANQCKVPTAAVGTFDGKMMHLATQSGFGAAYVAQFPRPVGLDFSMGRAVLNRRVDQVEDITADPGHSFAPVLGPWSVIAVPILRDGQPLGAISIGRPAMGPFSASQVALLQTFAEQAVIAIGSTETYRALQERTAALAQRNSEYGERIEQQSATIDVLKVMSSSPGNAQPVFELIVERARAFCGADQCTVALLEGDMLHLKAKAGMSEASARNYAAQFPRPVNTASMFGRAILAREAVQTPDVLADPEHFSRTRVGGPDPEFRAIVAVPMLRAGTPIGAIALVRRMPGVYSDIQMELLQTFAEQAVIAITSAETYRALQTRTGDLQEALEYQTATSDVLKVISRSTFDLQPVLTMVGETAARLCAADQAVIIRHENGIIEMVANFGFPPEYEAVLKELGPHRLVVDAPMVAYRAITERRVVHIDDVAAVSGYAIEPIKLAQQRTSLGVPLLRAGEPIGSILLARRRVEPFTDRQIELVNTFADQAVIAIENTRLLTEQQEALEQRTATAEVLQVINVNPGNLAPVFDAVLEKSLRLCEAEIGVLHTYDGDLLRLVATRGVPPALVDYLMEPHRPPPGGNAHRIVRGENIVHLDDVKDSDAYRSGDEARRAHVDLGGGRTAVYVALRKDNTLLGMIVIYRQEVRPFTDKQIALLESFAAQAVIAMENARLITEQREALEQQTATAEVLQVINTNPGNLTPVFDAILDKAHTLCGAVIGSLVLFDGTHFRAVATHGFPEQVASLLRHPVPPYSNTQELIDGVRFRQIEDIRAIWINPDALIMRAFVEYTDVRTCLFVPLRKDGALLGFISAFRPEVRAFSEKEIALLENFAAQAVIAVENARLITETREALEQQTATAEVLQVINASPGDLTPVFDALLEKALRLCEATFGTLAIYDGEYFRTGAIRGAAPALEEIIRDRRLERGPPPPGGVYDKVAHGADLVHIADVTDDEVYRSGNPFRLALVHEGGARTAIWVALRRDSTLLGLINIYRQEVRPFSEKQIALLRNFAAQAVIAMENARLLNEQREALEQQTATTEVLQVINASPGNLAPVFDAILEKAHRLCDATLGSITTYDGEYFRAEATRGYPEQYAAWMRGGFQAGPQSAQQALIDGKRFVHVADLRAAGPWHDEEFQRAFIEATGVKAFLVVPLRKDGSLLGYIAAHRQEARAFTDKEITLLENFAAQAVIAMENARLITEQREALEQQTATAEVLQVINASPGNLTPVFEAILEKAHNLCDVAVGSLSIYLNGLVHTAATRGFTEEYRALLRPPYPAIGSHQALMRGGPSRQTPDFRAHPVSPEMASSRYHLDRVNLRTGLWVPLRKDGTALGCISAYRDKVQPFSEKEIALLENFAAQAVIAMENARLLDEIRQRQEELRVTFDNMGDGVAMFDSDLRLTAWNRNFQRIIDLPDTLLETRLGYTDYLRLLAERGEFGTIDIEAELSLRIEDTDKELRLERVRPDGRVIEVRRNAVPGGGFVLIYSDITERKRSEEEIRAARDAAEIALRELRTAQANLIQAEKMASLGQLTAGIAHEIKNPLNFVNNFAELSVDLLGELKDAIAPAEPALTDKQRAEVEEVSTMLTSNLEKITEHGKRADGIVKAMLEHSRGSSGERRMVDLNTLIDEALNLAYHGARAQDQSFNITLERDFGEGIAAIELSPQDVTRVFLNLFANGFYATTRRAREGEGIGFVPTLRVTTREAGEAVEIRVRDNGTGIPADIRDKLFQPFFTTKPTGEGTGLGLSITYDIVTQQHGGSIAVDSKVGDYSEFTMRLPRKP